MRACALTEGSGWMVLEMGGCQEVGWMQCHRLKTQVVAASHREVEPCAGCCCVRWQSELGPIRSLSFLLELLPAAISCTFADLGQSSRLRAHRRSEHA